MKCRHCNATLNIDFLDLGFAPPSNNYLSEQDLRKAEIQLPLTLKVCPKCWLVQTEDYASSEDIFRENYAYFSSTSTSWLDHASAYVSAITERLALGADNFVIELASNDGYLLKNFVEAGIPCLGIEPTKSTAEAAEAVGVPSLVAFFGQELGALLKSEGKGADLLIGNNVYAHVPDINDFTQGMKAVLNLGGTITMEFPHLLKMIERKQFDTAYHEHFSYLSLGIASRIFETAGLRIFDVQELSTHGGSLRIFGCHKDDKRATAKAVDNIQDREIAFGLDAPQAYAGFQKSAETIKNELLVFLIEQSKKGKKVAAYGAAAKGNTLLNFAGVGPDLISFVVDAAPSKQGKFMPGSRIPILPPKALEQDPPDFVIILPWNIADEIYESQSSLCQRGVKFVTAIPELRVL